MINVSYRNDSSGTIQIKQKDGTYIYLSPTCSDEILGHEIRLALIASGRKA